MVNLVNRDEECERRQYRNMVNLVDQDQPCMLHFLHDESTYRLPTRRQSFLQLSSLDAVAAI